MYSSLPAEHLENLTPQEKVRKTIAFAQKFNVEINKILASTFHPSIQMAYEETLFPTYFCAKKYYTGRVHTTDYAEKFDLFIRGIVLVKRKTSKVCKMMGRQFLERLLDPYNKLSIDELRRNTYAEIASEDFKVDYDDIVG